ncbi:rodlin [Streptomyces sp. NPDC047028]|uniref:rodlin n=1 Tax=Streptomyces sp. NPDC047028 TaxID=3155793 RepID=UPI0033F39FF9
MKKLWATAAVAASVAGLAGVAAPQALAIGNDGATNALNTGEISEAFGNSTTSGDLSPQLGAIQGSLNKPCVGLPAKVNGQSILAGLNVGVQDIPIASSPQNQQCTENSTQAKGDDSLADALNDLSLLSRTGVDKL